MANQYQNEKEVELEDKLVPETSKDEKVDRIADEAARKASKTEKQFDQDHHRIFSK